MMLYPFILVEQIIKLLSIIGRSCVIGALKIHIQNEKVLRLGGVLICMIEVIGLE